MPSTGLTYIQLWSEPDFLSNPTLRATKTVFSLLFATKLFCRERVPFQWGILCEDHGFASCCSTGKKCRKEKPSPENSPSNGLNHDLASAYALSGCPDLIGVHSGSNRVVPAMVKAPSGTLALGKGNETYNSKENCSSHASQRAGSLSFRLRAAIRALQRPAAPILRSEP